jgi:hypothetical protein
MYVKRLAPLLIALLLAVPFVHAGKNRSGVEPVDETLAGITLGKPVPLKRGWGSEPGALDGVTRYTQSPQTLYRDDETYRVQARYDTNREGVAIYSGLTITYSNKAQCEEAFLDAFKPFAEAHEKPLEPGHGIIVWKTMNGHDFMWQNRCGGIEAAFELSLKQK